MKKVFVLLTSFCLCVSIVTCNGGSRPQQTVNTPISNNPYGGTPFADGQDLDQHLQIFYNLQLQAFNDNLETVGLFSITEPSALLSLDSRLQSSPSGNLLLDFKAFYVDTNDFSLYCLYRFLEKSDLFSVENYKIKIGYSLSRYVFSVSQDTWVFTGETNILVYEYLSLVRDGHRIITTVFDSPDCLNSSPIMASRSALTIDPASLLGQYNDQYIKWVSKVFENRFVMQVDMYPHSVKTSTQEVKTCPDWNKIPHINVRIYKIPRGSGSLSDTLNDNNEILQGQDYKDWVNRVATYKPGHEVANWHIGINKKSDGRICYLAGETKWKKLVSSGVEIPQDMLNQGLCKEYCLILRDFLKGTPWLLPWGTQIPDEILSKLAEELEKKFPDPPPVIPDEWWKPLGITASILAAIEALDYFFYSSGQLVTPIIQTTSATGAAASSIVATPFVVPIDVCMLMRLPGKLSGGLFRLEPQINNIIEAPDQCSTY